jgi:hypothetical protein
VTYPRLVLRNLLRHPLRMLLTTLSIALSIFLVCAVLTLPSALDAITARAASNVRISVHHKAGFTYWLPGAFVQEGAAPAGRRRRNHYSWFGGIYDEPKNLFPTSPSIPRPSTWCGPTTASCADALARASARAQRRARRRGHDAKFGWHVGQERHVEGHDLPVDLTFEIVGTVGGVANRPCSVQPQVPRRGHGIARRLQPRRHDLAARGEPEQVRTASSARSTRSSATPRPRSRRRPRRRFIASFMSTFQGLLRVILIVGFLWSARSCSSPPTRAPWASASASRRSPS